MHKDLQQVVPGCVLVQKQIAHVCLCGGARGVKGKLCSKKFIRDFLGGLVVKNPSANTGEKGSLPDPGRSHMPQGNSAHEPQLLSLCFRAWELQLLKPALRAQALQQEKSL